MKKYFGNKLKIVGVAIACCLPSALVLAQRTAPAAYASGAVANYVRSWDATIPDTVNGHFILSSPLQTARITSQYLDGLGRPIQTIVKQGSLITGGTAVDIVSAVVYDAFGREANKYLPFAANTTGGNVSLNDGLLKQNPFQQDSAFSKTQYPGENWFYSQVNFEPSPLNRVAENFASGDSWVGTSSQALETNRHSVKAKYWLNTTADSVRVWNVTDSANTFGSYATSVSYAAGLLSKNITVDEHGKQVVEFKDKDGLVILKKVQLTALPDTGIGKGYGGWLSTYYIYDVIGRLRCVVQPRGVELLLANSWNMTAFSNAILNEQCFRYEYDGKQRMILKKVPGAGSVMMVYDARDRIVMVQDSVMRAAHKWLYTQYEFLNRPFITGLITDNTNYNNAPYHWSHADTSIAYPNLGGYTNEELTRTFYDDYNWRTAEGNPLTSTRSTVYDTYLLAASPTVWPYPQTVTQSTQTKGLMTGTKIKVLGTASTFLYAVNFYDEKSRLVQSQSQNITGGTDISTTQYGWAGMAVLNVVKHEKAGTNAQTAIAVTKNTYDTLARLLKVEKRMSHTLVNSNTMSAWRMILQNEYDALGQRVKKKLGADPSNVSNPLETLVYDYNIRGWMLGMNRAYVKDTTSTANRFGFDLGYDKTAFSINASAKSYAAAQYNGNITGELWKSKGDGQLRKYDFTYDAVNRLTGADFNQFTSVAFNKNAGIDFTVTGLSYDANGNILKMNQAGLKLNTSSFIDSMLYTYYANSNRLQNVIDLKNDTATKLGDFRSSKAYMTALSNNKTGAATDYHYDGNGNMYQDNNKDISYIHYNHLNLPDSIAVTGKGYIKYVYDAGGNKLKKITTEGTKITTTTYLFGNYVNDTLQFLPQEEGRVRIGDSLVYDYFIKDHLGNVRMVLTDEVKTNVYPAATLEGTFDASTNSMVNFEKQFYKIDNTKIVADPWTGETVANTKLYYNYNSIPPGNPNYPASCTPLQTDGSGKVYKLNATTNKTGLEFVIKVMAGDKIDIMRKSYHTNASTIRTTNSTVLTLLELLTNFLGSPGNAAASKGFTAAGLNTANTGLVPSTFFRGDYSESGSTTPKAYINYIFFDEQFNYAGGNFSRVGGPNAVKDHWTTDASLQNITVPKNGYIFVYVSNESNFDVFFDNLQVIHKPGPIVEETHYYPFGLTMAGISSKAAGSLTNKIKYNNMELQNGEFSDGSGLEMYDYKYRFYDHQIGRFISQDALATKYPHYSPYQFAGNQVPNAIDLDGLEEFKVNDNKDGSKTAILSRVDAPFSVQYNGQKLDAFPQQNMNDYYQNNTIVKSEVDGKGNNRVSSVTTYDNNGSKENTFYDNVQGSKEIARDQTFQTFERQGALPMVDVTNGGTPGATILQNNNLEGNSQNNLTTGIPIFTDLLSFNASSMNSTNPATFTITNTDNKGNSTGVGPYVINGGTGVGSPAMISVVPGTYLNVSVTPGTGGGKFKYDVRTVDDSKPQVQTIPIIK